MLTLTGAGSNPAGEATDRLDCKRFWEGRFVLRILPAHQGQVAQHRLTDQSRYAAGLALSRLPAKLAHNSINKMKLAHFSIIILKS
jgi:hypothetical protein